jgi:hypothetical protein
MMQAVLTDQAKIRRSLRFVNKIGRGAARRWAAKYMLACIEETCWHVLPIYAEWFSETCRHVLLEHAGMY